MVLVFLSVVAELCLIEMESFFASGRIVSDRNGEFCTFFGGWLAAPAGQARHCSKSQNRRKCDGNGSNLQHLKDNWPGLANAALLGEKYR